MYRQEKDENITPEKKKYPKFTFRLDNNIKEILDSKDNMSKFIKESVQFYEDVFKNLRQFYSSFRGFISIFSQIINIMEEKRLKEYFVKIFNFYKDDFKKLTSLKYLKDVPMKTFQTQLDINLDNDYVEM